MLENHKVFDFHTHIFPEHIAESTLSFLSDLINGIKPSYDGTRNGLSASLKSAGYDGALNCPIATKVTQVESVNKWAIQNNQWPILSLGSIHPDNDSKPEILEAIAEAGLKGIKLHPEFQKFTVDDIRVQEIWQCCSDLGLLVLLHTGQDAAFTPPPKVDPESLVWLIDQFPNLKVVAGHFGSWQLWDDVQKHLVGKNIYFDLAFTLGLLDDDKVVDIIRNHGVEKVLYATDAPWRDQKHYLQLFLRLPLTQSEQEAILWNNARELLGFI